MKTLTFLLALTLSVSALASKVLNLSGTTTHICGYELPIEVTGFMNGPTRVGLDDLAYNLSRASDSAVICNMGDPYTDPTKYRGFVVLENGKPTLGFIINTQIKNLPSDAGTTSPHVGGSTSSSSQERWVCSAGIWRGEANSEQMARLQVQNSCLIGTHGNGGAACSNVASVAECIKN